MRQLVIVAGAIVIYFGVRGLTEGDVMTAERNAERVLELERSFGIAIETSVQAGVLATAGLVTLANWIYIWLHWPVLIGTLIWLIRVDRSEYLELRNAMIISGLIGMLIFAVFPVAPPRLMGLEYVDTVTERSHSYRVLQPPSFTNAYAAVPSLHFGWNLLVGLTWIRVGKTLPWKIAGVAMPLAMGWAVVATANHWVFDVLTGGTIALVGVTIERHRWVRWATVAADPDRSTEAADGAHGNATTVARTRASDTASGRGSGPRSPTTPGGVERRPRPDVSCGPPESASPRPPRRRSGSEPPRCRRGT